MSLRPAYVPEMINAFYKGILKSPVVAKKTSERDVRKPPGRTALHNAKVLISEELRLLKAIHADDDVPSPIHPHFDALSAPRREDMSARAFNSSREMARDEKHMLADFLDLTASFRVAFKHFVSPKVITMVYTLSIGLHGEETGKSSFNVCQLAEALKDAKVRAYNMSMIGQHPVISNETFNKGVIINISSGTAGRGYNKISVKFWTNGTVHIAGLKSTRQGMQFAEYVRGFVHVVKVYIREVLKSNEKADDDERLSLPQKINSFKLNMINVCYSHGPTASKKTPGSKRPMSSMSSEEEDDGEIDLDRNLLLDELQQQKSSVICARLNTQKHPAVRFHLRTHSVCGHVPCIMIFKNAFTIVVATHLSSVYESVMHASTTIHQLLAVTSESHTVFAPLGDAAIKLENIRAEDETVRRDAALNAQSWMESDSDDSDADDDTNSDADADDVEADEDVMRRQEEYIDNLTVTDLM